MSARGVDASTVAKATLESAVQDLLQGLAAGADGARYVVLFDPVGAELEALKGLRKYRITGFGEVVQRLAEGSSSRLTRREAKSYLRLGLDR